jgi:hypothetical protein
MLSKVDSAIAPGKFAFSSEARRDGGRARRSA